MARWNGKGLEPMSEVMRRGREELAKLSPEEREAELAKRREEFINIGKDPK